MNRFDSDMDPIHAEWLNWCEDVDNAHRDLWLYTCSEFWETETYSEWLSRLHEKNYTPRQAARTIERAYSLYISRCQYLFN